MPAKTRAAGAKIRLFIKVLFGDAANCCLPGGQSYKTLAQ
jgi:hypothetical protein